MVKKKKKSSKKVEKKVVEMRIEQPEDQGEFKLKKEPEVVEEKLLPSEPQAKPVKNPNDPVDTHVNEGYKRPSITNVQHVYTKKQFEALIDAYWKNFPDMKKNNPAKYEAKKSELVRKLKEAK